MVVAETKMLNRQGCVRAQDRRRCEGAPPPQRVREPSTVVWHRRVLGCVCIRACVHACIHKTRRLGLPSPLLEGPACAVMDGWGNPMPVDRRRPKNSRKTEFICG